MDKGGAKVERGYHGPTRGVSCDRQSQLFHMNMCQQMCHQTTFQSYLRISKVCMARLRIKQTKYVAEQYLTRVHPNKM